MESSRRQKIAYCLINLFAGKYLGLYLEIEDAISCISEIYSIDTNYAELSEVVVYLNEEWSNADDLLIKKQEVGNDMLIYTEIKIHILEAIILILEIDIDLPIDKYNRDFNNEKEIEEDQFEDDYQGYLGDDYNENDPMEIKRDEWGNLYTEGGRMWDNFVNKNKKDDDY